MEHMNLEKEIKCKMPFFQRTTHFFHTFFQTHLLWSMHCMSLMHWTHLQMKKTRSIKNAGSNQSTFSFQYLEMPVLHILLFPIASQSVSSRQK